MKKKPISLTGLDLQKAFKMARDMGCEVEPVRRTGEVLVTHPAGGRLRVNGRRKDAPRALTSYLQQLQVHLAALSVAPVRKSGWSQKPTPPRSSRRKPGKAAVRPGRA